MNRTNELWSLKRKKHFSEQLLITQVIQKKYILFEPTVKSLDLHFGNRVLRPTVYFYNLT